MDQSVHFYQYRLDMFTETSGHLDRFEHLVCQPVLFGNLLCIRKLQKELLTPYTYEGVHGMGFLSHPHPSHMTYIHSHSSMCSL